MGQNYPPNLRAAAYRHFEAAEILFSGNRKDVAGYLFGLAAECAFKALMISLGMRALPENQRREDPFYAHFVKLKTLLTDNDQGRKHHDLRKFSADPRFMAHWDSSMRYSDGKVIEDRWITQWRENAKSVMGEI